MQILYINILYCIEIVHCASIKPDLFLPLSDSMVVIHVPYFKINAAFQSKIAFCILSLSRLVYLLPAPFLLLPLCVI